jgi:hypothetical protein
MAFCGEYDPPRSCKIENLRASWNLEDHRAQMGAGERIETGAQRIGRIGGAHQINPRRIETECEQPGGEDFAVLERGIILPDPEKVFRRRNSHGHRRRKSRRCTAMRIVRENFVQRTVPQSALEHRIGFVMAERGKAMRTRVEPGSFERAFEGGQFFGLARLHDFVHGMFYLTPDRRQSQERTDFNRLGGRSRWD